VLTYISLFSVAFPQIPSLADSDRIKNDLEQLNITDIDHIVYNNKNTNPCVFEYGKSYVLACAGIGEPPPQVTWYNDLTIGETPLTGYPQHYLDNNRTLIVVMENFSSEDEGIYHCNATNSLGFTIQILEVVDVTFACE